MAAYWHEVRVYLEDTDAQGVVYNASYFRFMERARTDWLRVRGFDHSTFADTLGLAVVLASIEAKFIGPGRLGEVLAVSADLTELKGARAWFSQEIRRESSAGELIAEGRAEIACIDLAGKRARRWPRTFLEGLNG
ncbi:MAG TPA: YbgC/FadM family acyl-CoA thioesterase [Gammaproteobacteria bacterium]|jgi:4-hydroxybenzoyl-CoA thioesterase/acyl-CoA thioester hydrolase